MRFAGTRECVRHHWTPTSLAFRKEFHETSEEVLRSKGRVLFEVEIKAPSNKGMNMMVYAVRKSRTESESELIEYLIHYVSNVMCKRLIQACPRCKKWVKDLYMCQAFDKNKYPNMFSRGWFYEHAKRNAGCAVASRAQAEMSPSS
ncbi:hypothetical protein LTR49_028692 [Elasticomyces elasticus]|nr:hypothetical protein LTR49_028692 [Elasticomyces elasticus]KAK5734111.1 hypothetical protein LTS12_026790 [Elasticomyces elasticus]